ncbi:MAG TPA: hypothetical protein H9959_01630 [Candidatus Mediterraneibacter ornithocaccae]|uniref:sigma factor-like helix-turn-helix DNA-binding protein n=1 Tax=Mediterraneibacter glycyrrhizinilyticus TaxID=342942 RepID=UPI001F9FBEAC|nr:hypothetical protein [Candidatus Mediterraneibacter ornithocaccae]
MLITFICFCAHGTKGAAFSPTVSGSELTDISVVLAQVLQTLSESDRAVICLRYVLELNPSEIGRIMNLSRYQDSTRTLYSSGT